MGGGQDAGRVEQGTSVGGRREGPGRVPPSPDGPAEIVMEPGNTLHLDGKKARQCLKLLGALEDQDDVQSVSANLEFDEAELEAEVT